MVDNCGSVTACPWVTCSILGIPTSTAVIDGHLETVQKTLIACKASVPPQKGPYTSQAQPATLLFLSQDMLGHLKIYITDSMFFYL